MPPEAISLSEGMYLKAAAMQLKSNVLQALDLVCLQPPSMVVLVTCMCCVFKVCQVLQGKHSGYMVGALDLGSHGPGSSLGRGHCVALHAIRFLA